MSQRTTRSKARPSSPTRSNAGPSSPTRSKASPSSQTRSNAGPSSQMRRRVVEEDDEPLAQSQRSQGSNMSHEEESQLIGSVIRYLLAVDRTKHVIHRQQLVKNVFGTYSRHYRRIMIIVKQTMLEVFGFKLVEFETSKYIITNAIPNDAHHLGCPAEEQPRRTLLVLVLTHIFMSDDICREELMWAFLRKLTIVDRDNFVSNYFGDVKKIVTVEFVKQQYLEMQKIGASEPPLYEFKWGPRAEEEISKREVLQFVSKMYNNRRIDHWPRQFKAIQAAERIANGNAADY